MTPLEEIYVVSFHQNDNDIYVCTNQFSFLVCEIAIVQNHIECLEAIRFRDASDYITLYSNLVRIQASPEICG